MSANPATEPCRTCGAPMYANESFCPKCRSPRPGGKPEYSRFGLLAVALVIIGGIVGAVVRFALDSAH